MGKTFEFIKKTQLPDSGKIRVFWAPDFSMYIEKTGEPPVLLAHLNVDNALVWNESCQLAMGFSAEEAPGKMVAFQRT